MTVTYKPILFEQGVPRPIPRSFFSELFNGQAAMPMHAGRSLDCVLAFIRGPQQGIYTLTALQCMRINFNEHGVPATWHMSMVDLAAPCALAEGNRPLPRTSKQRKEPHFWFPDQDEMELIAKTLMEQYAPRPKGLRITSASHPSTAAQPPFIPRSRERQPAAH